MGSAFYLVFDREHPNFDPFVNGKALAHSQTLLADAAQKLSVTPLMEFFSAEPDDLSDFLDEDADETTSSNIGEVAWFDPADGLRTVTALLQHFKSREKAGDDVNAVIRDLVEFERALTEARAHGLKWHLAIDY